MSVFCNPKKNFLSLCLRYWKTDIKGAEEGSLEGKTVGIKDNIPVSGVPMMNGSRMLEGYTPEFDATVVTRVLDAGKLFIVPYRCGISLIIMYFSHNQAKS